MTRNISLFITLVITLLQSCNSDNTKDNSIPKVELSININTSDLIGTTTSRTSIPLEEELIEVCPDQNEVFKYAANGELTLNIAIYKNNVQLEIDPIEIKLSQNGLYTKPFEVDLGAYVIKYAEIIHKTRGVIFRTISKGALYSSLMLEEQLMDKIINYTEADLYQKNPISLDLVCSIDRDPYNFTYFLSEINMSKVYCFPFSINTCPDGQHIIGQGNLEIWTVKYIDNNGVAGFAKNTLFHSTRFDNSNGLSQICFKDDLQRDDEDEWLYMRLILDNNDPDKFYDSYVNVKRLKAYRNEDEWNNTYNYMHIDFCENDTYIFEKDPNEGKDPKPEDDKADCFKEFFSRCDYPNWGNLTIKNLWKEKDIESILTKKSFGIFKGSILRKKNDWHDRYLSLGVKSNVLRLWSTPYINMNNQSKISLDVTIFRLWASHKDKIELRLMNKNNEYVGKSVVYNPKYCYTKWKTINYPFKDFEAPKGEYRLVVICYIYGIWKIIGFDNIIICAEKN